MVDEYVGTAHPLTQCLGLKVVSDIGEPQPRWDACCSAGRRQNTAFGTQ